MGGYPVAGTGESIEELEQELNLPQGALVNTLSTYNQCAQDAQDPTWHKNPKYLTPLRSTALCGLRLDRWQWRYFRHDDVRRIGHPTDRGGDHG